MPQLPVYPAVIDRPFAANGDKASIPATAGAVGRATLADGFPVVTQQPLNAGGVPPSRLDFNGILNLLSQYAMWQQAGGLANWSATLNYVVPAMVVAGGKLYLARASSGPAVAGVGAKDPIVAANAAYWLDYAASITPPPAEKYDIGQYEWFEDDMPREGFFTLLGGVVTNFSRYPKAVAYFSTTYGQKRLVTQAQYDALHVATWHTCADGTKIGWNGIGGVNKFVWDKAADTLRLPDLAGMTPEQVGYIDSLGVGGVRPDQIRNIAGTFTSTDGYPVGVSGTGVITSDTPTGRYGVSGSQWYTPNSRAIFSANNVVPTGPRNHGPRWISDARVYLGVPVS